MKPITHFETLLISGSVNQEVVEITPDQDLQTIYHLHANHIDASINQMVHTLLDILHQIKDSVVQIGSVDILAD